MNYSTKVELISQLEQIHDEIKRHPFRYSFDTEDIDSYKHLLYELGKAWGNLIFRCNEWNEDEHKLYRQFSYWIHDYNENLRLYNKNSFPMELFDYYERMLQVTHRYLNTGEFDTFYNIDVRRINGNREKYVEKYQLITKELCDIDSPELPRFYPIGRKLCVDEDTMKNYLEHHSYTYQNKPEEQKRILENWKQNVKPILVWINENLVNKTDYEHEAWETMK